MPPMQQFKRLDVRLLLARGEEPFPVVRSRVGALNVGEGLLGSEGFTSKVERGDGGSWIVYIWRAAD